MTKKISEKIRLERYEKKVNRDDLSKEYFRVQVLDNYFRLKIIKFLLERSYYLKDLQKLIKMKGYSNFFFTIRKLEICGFIIKVKHHNTRGQKVKVSLNKDKLKKYESYFNSFCKAHGVDI